MAEASGWIDAKGVVHLEPGAEPAAPLPPDMAGGFTAVDTYVGWAEGWWMHGATLYVERRDGVSPDVVGRLCIVRLPDRTMKLRVVHAGARPGTWRLRTVNGEADGGDTVISSAGPVILTRHPTR